MVRVNKSFANILKSVLINGLFVVGVYLVIHTYQTRNLATNEAPELGGSLLSGGEFSGLEALKKPAIIHFWATWCSICQFEHDSINRLSHDYAVVTISSSSGSDQDVQQFILKNNISFPVINDASSRISTTWGVAAYPTSFIIDDENKIRFVEVGLTTEMGLRLRLWLTKLF